MSDAAESKTIQIPTLSVQLVEKSVGDMVHQRHELNEFIKSCLNPDVDFGTIPGTHKPSLFKPGAEKLAKLFKLGSRIVDKGHDINMEKNWALFSYTVEVFHLPSGNVISQCEGSANSHEKKYKSRPVADQLNTLQKMAQKRAYVGAVLIATGASDFFTQDVEDMDLGAQPQPQTRAQAPQGIGDYVCTFGKYKGQALADIGDEELDSYCAFIRRKASEDKKPLRGQVLEFLNAADAYLKSEDPLGKIPF